MHAMIPHPGRNHLMYTLTRRLTGVALALLLAAVGLVAVAPAPPASAAAKRLIVELRESWARQAESTGIDLLRVQAITADTVLRVLAVPYTDRPGFREEWRP